MQIPNFEAMVTAVSVAAIVWVRDFRREFSLPSGHPSRDALRTVLHQRNGIGCNLENVHAGIREAAGAIEWLPPEEKSAVIEAGIAWAS